MKKSIVSAVALVFAAGAAVVVGVGTTQAATPATNPAPVAAVVMPTTSTPAPVCPACDQLIGPQGHCKCSR